LLKYYKKFSNPGFEQFSDGKLAFQMEIDQIPGAVKAQSASDCQKFQNA